MSVGPLMGAAGQDLREPLVETGYLKRRRRNHAKGLQILEALPVWVSGREPEVANSTTHHLTAQSPICRSSWWFVTLTR